MLPHIEQETADRAFAELEKAAEHISRAAEILYREQGLVLGSVTEAAHTTELAIRNILTARGQ
jgi:hypothetical protein